MALRLYLFLLEANATEALAKAKPELKAGARYAINCFAVEHSLDKAKEPLDTFFSKMGWTGLEIRQEKEVPAKLSAIPDPEMQKMAKVAGEKGIAFTVYSTEIKPNA